MPGRESRASSAAARNAGPRPAQRASSPSVDSGSPSRPRARTAAAWTSCGFCGSRSPTRIARSAPREPSSRPSSPIAAARSADARGGIAGEPAGGLERRLDGRARRSRPGLRNRAPPRGQRSARGRASRPVPAGRPTRPRRPGPARPSSRQRGEQRADHPGPQVRIGLGGDHGRAGSAAPCRVAELRTAAGTQGSAGVARVKRPRAAPARGSSHSPRLRASWKRTGRSASSSRREQRRGQRRHPCRARARPAGPPGGGRPGADRPGRSGPASGVRAPRPSSVPRACTRPRAGGSSAASLRQDRDGRAVAAVDEEPLDVVAEVPLRAVERGGQVGSGEPLEVRARGRGGRPSGTTR